MKRHAMLITILLLAVPALGAEGQCNACDNTLASDCRDYSGDASAVESYDEDPTLTFQFGADLDSVCAHVMLHNPTEDTAHSDTECEFFFDGWRPGSNIIEDVVVCPTSSVEAEVCWADDFDEFTQVSANCVTVWR